MLLFGPIIGGLYAKWFTPAEAAGIGAGLAIAIAALNRRLTLTALREVFSIPPIPRSGSIRRCSAR